MKYPEIFSSGNNTGFVVGSTVMALLVLAFGIFLATYILNVPMSDSVWNILDVGKFLNSDADLGSKWSRLVSNGNEHKNLFVFPLSGVVYFLTGEIDFRLFTWLGNVLFIVFLFLWWRFGKMKDRPLLFIPIMLVMMQPMYYMITLRGLMGLQHFGVLTFSLLAFHFITRDSFKHFIIGSLCMVYAVFVFGNGLMTPVVCIILLALSKKWKRVGWATFAGVTSYGLFFWGWSNPDRTGKGISGIFEFILSFLKFCGGLSSPMLKELNILFGVALLLGFALLFFLGKLKDHPFVLGLVLFAFGSLFLVTVQRSGIAVGQEFSPKYKLYPTIILASLLYILLLEYRNQKMRIGVVLFSLLFSSYAWASNYGRVISDYKQRKEILSNWDGSGHSLRRLYPNMYDPINEILFRAYLENEYKPGFAILYEKLPILYFQPRKKFDPVCKSSVNLLLLPKNTDSTTKLNIKPVQLIPEAHHFQLFLEPIRATNFEALVSSTLRPKKQSMPGVIYLEEKSIPPGVYTSHLQFTKGNKSKLYCKTGKHVLGEKSDGKVIADSSEMKQDSLIISGWALPFNVETKDLKVEFWLSYSNQLIKGTSQVYDRPDVREHAKFDHQMEYKAGFRARFDASDLPNDCSGCLLHTLFLKNNEYQFMLRPLPISMKEDL